MSQKKVSVVEVSPRDGLQSEPEVLSTESKLEFIARAVDAGITRLEVA
ncbi:MAG: hydroxymethylglutaryl-CoA lyase, partial [Gammaproteobacteria bacterium]|nr:hydroxymethylglutaryl-CoA lyase [Gammaproteobacteria bacterium]